MCPWWNLPDEHILDGDSLLFCDTVDNSVVKDILFNYMTPQNTRIDLMSSLFGRDGDTNEPADKICETMSGDDKETLDSFDVTVAGPPRIEPRFGTKFWVDSIPSETLQQWSNSAAPQLPSPDLLLNLPPQNPFIPTKLDLKPLPGEFVSDDMLHIWISFS